MKAKTIFGAMIIGAASLSTGAHARDLTLASGPSGGTWYPLAAAIANIIEEEIPGTRVSVVNGVTVANILGTDAKQYDLAMSLSTANVDAIKGAAPFDEPKTNIRGVVGFYTSPYQMAVSATSEIRSVTDFEGKVINPGVVGGSTDVLTQTMLELNGLSYDDMARVERLSYSDASMQLKDGHLDIFTGIISVPSGAIAEAALGNGVRLIPMPQETIASLQERNNGYVTYEIPAGVYEGQDETVMAVGMNNVLIANADLDPALVQRITASIVTNAERLHDVNAALRNFSAKTAPNGIGAPLHPGAQAFFDASAARN